MNVIPMNRSRLWGVFLITIVAGWPADAWAQARSALVGAIRDADGAPVPGAAVSLQHQSPPGEPVIGVTNVRGVFRFAELTPGDYELTATQGTLTVRRTGLRLPVGTTLTVDLAFRATQEAATIGGSGPVVDVTTAALTTNFDREELENLPIGGVAALQQFAPGISRAFFGSAGDTNQVMIDGSPAVFTLRDRTASPAIHPYWMDEAQIVSLGANASTGETRTRSFKQGRSATCRRTRTSPTCSRGSPGRLRGT